MKTCAFEGCIYSVFGGGYCLVHQFLREDGKAPKPLKRSAIKQKGKKGIDVKKAEQEAMWDFFLSLWDQRENDWGCVPCFETRMPLVRDLYRGTTLCYHHVLEKNKNAYPQYRLTAANIVIIHPDVHSHIGINTPRIDAYRKKLLELHYKGLL